MEEEEDLSLLLAIVEEMEERVNVGGMFDQSIRVEQDEYSVLAEDGRQETLFLFQDVGQSALISDQSNNSSQPLAGE